jgi:hypothetical protein
MKTLRFGFLKIFTNNKTLCFRFLKIFRIKDCAGLWKQFKEPAGFIKPALDGMFFEILGFQFGVNTHSMIQELLNMFCFGTAIPTSISEVMMLLCIFFPSGLWNVICSLALNDHFGFCSSGLDCPGSLSLFLLFPFCWVFCLMKLLTGFHHLSIP